MADQLIRIKLTKSPIGAIPSHRRTVEALGLKKMQSEVELPDTPQTRGAVRKVRHLVTVTDLPAEPVESVAFASSAESASPEEPDESASQDKPDRPDEPGA